MAVEKVDGSVTLPVNATWVEYSKHDYPRMVPSTDTPVEVTAGLESGSYRFVIVAYGAGPNPKAVGVSDTYWLPP